MESKFSVYYLIFYKFLEKIDMNSSSLYDDFRSKIFRQLRGGGFARLLAIHVYFFK
jgi:hypothetical protein